MVRPLPEGRGPGEGGPLTGEERRPVPRLLLYYFLQALATGPGFVVVFPLRYVRYRTLRYEFDDEGVSMRWGVLFRREVSLTYTRIQDLHLVSNVIERWLGLGRIQVQTASGSAEAEMTLEGLPDFEALRDRLYGSMRGARSAGGREEEPAAVGSAELHTAVSALRDAAAELRAIRLRLEQGGR